MRLKENKIRRWKKGTRLFRTYTTWEKKVRRWGRRCRIVWWEPCKYYFTDEKPDWYSGCPLLSEKVFADAEEWPKVCETYGYKPRFGKISKIDCATIMDHHTEEEIEKLKQEGKIATW